MDNQAPVTISQLYKYKPIKTYVGLEGNLPVKHKDVYVGVEIELENVHAEYHIGTNALTEDGSLKVHGKEFVTIPLKMRYLEVELYRIFSGLKDPLVSSRCSTHVHVNVRDMTPNQIVNMVLLYTIFERSLYRVCGDRWDSNFCIPLALAPQLLSNFLYQWDNFGSWTWSKYTGLNLCPIWGGESTRIGTVEFRQMHGSTDVEEIMTWCNIITSLKRYAQEIDQEELIAHIRTMNTTSGYYWLVKEVFGKWAKLLSHQPTFAKDVEDGITLCKYCMPTTRYYSEKKVVTTTVIPEPEF